ncbi:MAG TPA: hypothetical protein VLI46_10070 [Ramlibacter sp.]|nr:hypothetical protein [Ramlibacter sp.]
MKQQVSRAVAKNAVIVATMGLAVFASWAVAESRPPMLDLGAAAACSAVVLQVGAPACKDAGGQG